jgi:PAS domain S-box-containing protein
MPGKDDHTNHISQQRKAQTGQPHTSEEGFRRLVELSFDGIVIHSEGRVVFVNPAGAKLIGAETPEQLVGKPMLDFVHPDYRGVVEKRVQKAIEEGERVPLLEEKLVRLDGEEIDVEVTGISTTYEGKPAVQVVLRDITGRKRAEKTLQQERNLLSRIMETSPVGIVVVDRTGQITFANNQAEQVLGLIKNEITQRTYNAPEWRITDYDGQAFPDENLPFRRVMDTQQPVYDVRHAIEWPDGRRVLLSINAMPLFDETGQVNGMVAAVDDVTERVQAEQKLREAERRFRTLLDNVRLVAVGLDKEGNVAYANPYFLKLTGYTPDEVLGKNWFQTFIPERDRPVVDTVFSKVIEAEIHPHYEKPILTRDGEERWIAWNNTSLLDPNGKPIGTMSIGEDITERKRAEKALKKAELEKEAILDSLVEHVIYEDTELKILWPNQAACESAGRTREELIGCHCYEIWPKRSEPCLDCPVVEAIRTGQPRQVEKTTPDGRIWFIRGYPVRDESNKVIGAVEVTLEITERKRAEEALRKSEARLQSIFRAAPVGIGLVSNRVLLEVNDRISEMLGYSRDELVGKNARMIYPTDKDFEYVGSEKYRQIREHGTGTVETRWRRKDGEVIDVLLSSTALDPADLSAGVTFTALDITERKRVEKALRESENNLKQAQQIAHLGSWALDIETNEFTVSEEMVRIYRYENSYTGSVSMEEFAQYIYPDDRERVASALGDAIAGRAPYDLEFRIARTDGEIRTLHAQGEVIRDESDKPIRVIGTGLDVTEHKRAEEELLRAQREWEEIFQAIGQPTLILDPRYHITAANRAAVRATGKSEDELLGRKCYEIFHKAETDHAPEGCPMEMMLASGRFETAEMEMEALEGLFLVSCTPVLDEAGRLEKVIHIATDITEHRRLEREIEERRSYLESVLANAPDAIVTMDAHHHILEWNPGAERLFGYAREEAVGRNIDELVTGTDADVIGEATDFTRRIISGENIPPTETIRYRKGGSPVDVIVSGSPIFMGDEVGGVIAVYTDITERKRTEEVLRRHERLAAVGQLAGGIAHDFNNLLTTIMLYAQMSLSKPDLPPDLVRSLETIISESRQATDLVQQILDFSRRSPIETYPVYLGPFIKEAFRVLQRTIPESISPLLEVGTGTYRVNADPTRIQQVLMNLVINARDAMPEGGKLVIGLSRVDTSPGQKPPVRGMVPGKWICLSVSDTGTGIPPNVLPHIFEPFFTTKPRERGTGLGLPQVYGIVAQHEGFIGVETEVGKGTTFQVYLPAHEAEKAEPLQKEEKVPPPPEGKGEIILLVEDNKRIREAGRDILESLGYRVLTAVNGQMALMVYQTAEKIDLVLTDVVMPEMGGKELVRELKRREPGLKTLAITGHLLTEDQKDLEKEGILDIIYKPFDVNVLAEVVRRVLDED